MRTTIRLDDTLLRRAKAQAAAAGRTLNDFIADAVRTAVAARPGAAHAVALPTFKGRGLQPGVDLDDSSALVDEMESGVGSYRVPAGSARRVAQRPRRRD
jgi:hypothetical protein